MPYPKGEAIPHYIELYEEGIPLSTGQKIKSRKQAIAIGLSEERRVSKKGKKSMKKRKRRRRKNPQLTQGAIWRQQSILGGAIDGGVGGAWDGLVNWLKSPADPVLGVPVWAAYGIAFLASAALVGSAIGTAAVTQPARVLNGYTPGYGTMGALPTPGYGTMQGMHGIKPVQGVGSYNQNMMFGPPYYAGQLFGRRNPLQG